MRMPVSKCVHGFVCRVSFSLEELVHHHYTAARIYQIGFSVINVNVNENEIRV